MSRRGGLTDAQRASFFGKWWPACCEVQGWDHQSEKLRREFVLEATTKFHREVPGAPTPTNRLSLCNQKQLSAVFKLTWHKTKPDSLNEMMPIANPEEAAEADEQRRAVFALSSKGLTTDEIARITTPLCRKYRVGDWQRLPSSVLKGIMHWKQFQPAEVARRHQVASMPLAPASDDSRVYYLRPARTAKAACAGPF